MTREIGTNREGERLSRFEVIVLGVGDTFSDRHHTTALLLHCDGVYLGVDCPDVYRSVVRDASERSGRELSLSDIDNVLITHVHGDHMNGLEGVAFFKHFVDGRRIRLLTVPEVSEVIWDQRLRVSMGVLWNGHEFRTMERSAYFDDQTLSWTEENRLGPFRIWTYRTRHHVPTCAIRVEAAGRTLGYSSDTAFDPALIEFLSQADLIIHETNLGPAHTPYEQLAALPEELRRKMRLIHYPDFFDVSGSNIVALREGEVLEV